MKPYPNLLLNHLTRPVYLAVSVAGIDVEEEEKEEEEEELVSAVKHGDAVLSI
jgi:hypothetical protein